MIGPSRYEHPPGSVTMPVRDFSCWLYNDCLRAAAHDNWPSATCLGCALCTVGDDHEFYCEATADDDGDLDLVEAGAVVRTEPCDVDIAHCCIDCGREGDAYSVHLVDGAPKCILCRPDLGRGRVGVLSRRVSPGTRLDRPMISMAGLARLTRATMKTVRPHILSSVQYRLHDRRDVLLPARLYGIICENPLQHGNIMLDRAEVGAWLGLRSRHGGALIELMGGQPKVHWLDLAHRLHDRLLIGGSHAD